MIWAAFRLLAEVPRWLRFAPRSNEARSLARRALNRFAERCGLRIRSSGEAVNGGTLFVANHISWADIVVLGSLCDAGFVARSDLAGWPLIGRIAQRRGTIFVTRERRMESGRQVEAMRQALAAGEDLILFAEGTTSVGTSVLPFRPALLAAADAARRVQPVVVAYLDAAGLPLSPERQRQVAWIGDDGTGHVLGTFAGGPLTAAVRFLPPLDPARFASRKALADAAYAAASEAYAALRNRSK